MGSLTSSVLFAIRSSFCRDKRKDDVYVTHKYASADVDNNLWKLYWRNRLADSAKYRETTYARILTFLLTIIRTYVRSFLFKFQLFKKLLNTLLSIRKDSTYDTVSIMFAKVELNVKVYRNL